MTQAFFKSKFNNLPDNLKSEVIDFINFLNYKLELKKISKHSKRHGYGSLKGKITMADDFDQPLEDFRKYM